VATNLAMGLAATGRKVGLLDVDFHGPSVPKLLGLEGRQVGIQKADLVPVSTTNGLKVMSIAFLLEDPDSAVIWRGPMKMGVIEQFLKDVSWGDLDYLIVDCPPGTGDEPLSILQKLPEADGAVVVTTPQEVALADVRKSIRFCAKLDMAVIGVVENMSGFACPHCGKVTDILKSGGGESMAQQMQVPFLGRIPLDPEIMVGGDVGVPYVSDHTATATGTAWWQVVKGVLVATGEAEVPEGD
jgi:Mrp family chromosome partitioning ATPase